MGQVENRELANHRLSVAFERLNAAGLLFASGLYADAVSRAYYAVFSAARAMLATKSLDSRKHSGVISLFNQHFVKTEIISKEAGRLIMEARDLREEGDYNDFYVTNEKDASKVITGAKMFLSSVSDFFAGNDRE
ncbi:MAG TPA: HEPN domain-containing protein [Spirochaetia bacterium]|nr:HEPN domain-containing protein [Spirochaetia bacterium]